MKLAIRLDLTERTDLIRLALLIVVQLLFWELSRQLRDYWLIDVVAMFVAFATALYYLILNTTVQPYWVKLLIVLLFAVFMIMHGCLGYMKWDLLNFWQSIYGY